MKKKGRKKSADIDLLTHIKEMPQHLTYEQNTSTVMLDSQKGIFSSANLFHKIRFIPDSKIGAKFFHHKRKLLWYCIVRESFDSVNHFLYRKLTIRFHIHVYMIRGQGHMIFEKFKAFSPYLQSCQSKLFDELSQNLGSSSFDKLVKRVFSFFSFLCIHRLQLFSRNQIWSFILF